MDARLTRSGRVLRLVHNLESPDVRGAQALQGLLVRAHGWWAELRRGEIDVKQLAAKEGVSRSYLTRVLRLAFLAPELTKLILAGRQPANVGVRALTLTGTVAASWAA